MDFQYYNDSAQNEGEDEEEGIFNFIQTVSSMDIVYSQPEIKYKFIGPYIKGDLLGEGSYGKVKECIHSRTLRRCAVKIMTHKKLRRIPNGEQNVQREIQLHTGLKHKNVIQLLDVMHFTLKQKIYIVMEYCVTGLQDMLENTPSKKFPVWQAHRYFIQLASGLEYLHSKGVIHKDIKPDNLLLTTNSTLKIIDFGVAEQLDPWAENDMITTSQGSPVFQPPEVAGGAEKFPGFKYDVWSAGITLFNIVTGEYPFVGATVFSIYRSICDSPLEIPSDLEPPLQALLRAMLHKDPLLRITLHEVRKHEWCLRKQIPSAQDVGVPLISTNRHKQKFTAIDAIKKHYYNEPDGSSSSQQYITEHELNESNKDDHVSIESNSEVRGSKSTKLKKKKPISCINIKSLPSCSQS